MLFLLLPLLALSPAAPSKRTEVEQLLKKGVELRRQGNDVEALQAFQAAQALEPSARAQAQIALAEQALSQWVEAERDLLAALAQRTDPWIKGRRATLEEALAQVQARLGWLELSSPTAGATVEVNGQPPVPLPLAKLRLAAGPVKLVARAEGMQRLERTVQIVAKQSLGEELRLEPLPPPPPPPKRVEAPPPQLVAARPREAPPARLTPFAYGAGGVALAGAGVGAAFLLIREKHAARYNDDSICLPANGLSRDQNCGEERKAAEQAGTIATAGLITAGAMGVVSVVLFLLDPGDSGGAPPAAGTVACGPGGAALGCGLWLP